MDKNNKMNRKGQLDKALEGLPVFFSVIIILAVFIMICAGILGAKSISEKVAVMSYTNVELVFDKISVKNSSGQFENMTVLQGFRENKLNQEMKDALLEIAPVKGCLYFHYKAITRVNGVEQEMVFYQNKVERKSDWIDDLTGKGLLTYVSNLQSSNYTFSFLNAPVEKYVIETYSGRCIDEK